MLICAYWLIKNEEDYKELGANYVDQNTQEKKAKYYAKQLKKLGITGVDEFINPQLQGQYA